MIMEVKLNLPRKKQITTMNRCISTVMYFESRPLISCPHLRKVSNISQMQCRDVQETRVPFSSFILPCVNIIH